MQYTLSLRDAIFAERRNYEGVCFEDDASLLWNPMA